MFSIGGEPFEDKKEGDGSRVIGDIVSTSQYREWLNS